MGKFFPALAAMFVGNMMEPPVVLVKTWLSLAWSNEDQDIKERALKMLEEKVGDHKAIAAYMEKHGIR